MGTASSRISLPAALPPSRRRLLRHRWAAAVVCSRIRGSGELGLRSSVTSVSTVVTAAANNVAAALLLVLCLEGIGRGTGSLASRHGGRSGGGRHEMDFVPVPHRLDDAGSGVVERFWALHRSVFGSGLVPAHGGRKQGGRSGAVAPDLEVERLRLMIVSTFQGSSLVGGRFLLKTGIRVLPFLVLWCPAFLCSAGDAGGGGLSEASWWCSVAAVVLVPLSLYPLFFFACIWYCNAFLYV